MDDRDISDALFICQSCHRPCITSNEAWSNLLPNPRQRRQIIISMSSFRSANIILYHKNPPQWVFRAFFDGFQKELEAHRFFTFPICSICAISQTKIYSAQIAFYNKLSVYMVMHAGSAGASICDQVSKEIVEINKSDRKSMIFSSEARIRRISRAPLVEASTQQQRQQIIERNIYIQSQQTNEENDQKNSNLQCFNVFGSISFCTVFSIGSNRHYGTINGARLGTKTPDSVPIDELQSGFLFLGQMIVYISQFLDIDTSNFRISSILEIKEKGKFVPFIPTSKKTKSNKSFKNEFLDELFLICQNIFYAEPLLSCKYSPTVPIDSKKHIIGNESFYYKSNEPWKFTSSMKKLLTNFKDIQLNALRSRIMILS